jgi:gliding motility-associated-like protein
METRIFALIVLFILPLTLTSQVACDAPLLKNVVDYCSKNAEHSNAGTTSSGIGAGFCWSDKTSTQETWFRFNAIGTDIAITVSGDTGKGTIVKPCISLYTGDCTATTPFSEVSCADFGKKNITELYHAGLTPGIMYYIRVASTIANAGTFTLCVNNTTPTANPGADCNGAVKLCNKNQVNVPGLHGGGNNPNEPEQNSCMYFDPKLGNSERNSCWYYWVCDKSGTLTFDLTPINPNNDLDFNLYSITKGTDVCKNRKIERCSATAKVVGATGLNMTETDVQEPITLSLPDPNPSNAYVKYLDMVSGTTYALLINNASDKSGFTINFGGTGTFVGPTANATADKISICPGKTITFDGSKSIHYNDLNWNFLSGGNPVTANGPGPHSIQYDTPGDYVAILKATDTIGCNSITSVNVTVVKPVPLLVTPDSICMGETAMLKASPDIPGATYTWQPIPASGNGTAVITDKPQTQQTYTVTCEKDGCRSMATGTVYFKSDVKINDIPSQTICIGGKATLKAEVTGGSGSYTFNWLPAGTGNTASVTVSPSATQQYTVSINDGNASCPAPPQTVTVKVNPPLSVIASPPDTICSGSNASIAAYAVGGNGGPYKYTWQPTGDTIQSIQVHPSVTTVYTVTVNDLCGTPVAVDSTVIVVVQPVVLKVSSDSICLGETATLNATPNVTGATYSWKPAPDSGDGTSTITAKPTSQQTYTVTCSKDGCLSTATGLVFIKPTGIISPIPPVTICIGNSASLQAMVTGGSGSYLYSWLPAGTGNTASVAVSPVLTQQYTVNVTDGSDCPIAPRTVMVTVRPPLSVAASIPDTICSGSSIILHATAKGGDENYNYLWQPVNTNGSSITVKPAFTTTYTVTVSDKCGTPPASDTVTVTVVPAPVVNFGASNSTGCAAPLCVSFRDSSTTAIGKIRQWKWNFGVNSNGTPEGGSDIQHPKHCYKTSGKYTVTLTVTNSFGCTASASKANLVTVYPTPVADFSMPDVLSILSPEVTFQNTSIGGSKWDWNFGDSLSGKNSSTLFNPEHLYSAIGTYCIRLIASNNYGCIDTTVKCLTVEPTSSIYIPNAFTPNADGKNDTFFAKGDNITEFHMLIYDRWGNLIFYSDDMNKQWDGCIKPGGEIAQQDVYIYVVTAKDIHNKSHRFIGTVTLVK